MAEGSLYRIELDVKELRRQTEEVNKLISGIGTKAEQEGGRIDGAMKKIGAAMAGYFTAQQAISFAQSIVQVRSEIESLEVSFRTLLGSEEKASQLFGEIRQFAVNTPMMMNDLSKGAQTLLAFNYDADKVMPTLKALGDISMGDSQKFTSLTLAFAQMSSAGKLMGQDLMQMINAGFNPLAEMSAKTGKSIGELKDEMSKGAISAQMVEEAFISATSEGGKFYGMLEAQSKTMAGAISNLQGAWEDMLNAIGEETQGVFAEAVGNLTDIVKNYEEFGRVIAELIAVYGTYKAAVITTTAIESLRTMGIGALTLAEKAHYGWLVLCEKAQSLLNKTLLKNPYALAAAALVAMAAAIYNVYKKQHELSESMQAIENISAEMETSLAKERLEIDRLFISLKNAKKGSDEYKTAKEAIISKYGSYLKGLSDEITSLQDIEGAYKAITAAALESAKARAAVNAQNQLVDIAAQSEGDVRVELKKMVEEVYGGKKTTSGRDAAEYVWQQVEKYLNEEQYMGSDFNYKTKIYNNPYLSKLTEETNSFLKGNRFMNAIDKLRQIKTDLTEGMKELETRFGTPAAETPTETKQEEEVKTISDEEKKKAEARKAAIKEYERQMVDETRQVEFRIQQAEIDAMDEGLAKSLAQNQLNYEKAIEDNRVRKEAMEKSYSETYGKNAELPQAEKNILQSYATQATMEYQNANREALAQALEQYATYEQKRTQVAEEYEKRRRSLQDNNGNLLDGVTQGNIDELNLQAEQAIAAVDQEFAMRSETYQSWLEQVAQMSLAELQKALEEAQRRLAELQNTGTADPQQLAVVRAQIDKLTNSIKKANANKLEPVKTRDWTEMNAVVGESVNIIRTLSQSFDDATREILESVASIAEVTYGIVGNIVKLVDNASSGMVATSAAAATAMSTLEKASVILAIISAAIQIAQIVANLADPDKYADKTIEKYQNKYDQIEWSMNNRQSRLIAQFRRKLWLEAKGLTEDFVKNSEITGDTLLELLDQAKSRLAFKEIGDQMSMGILEYERKLKKLMRSEEAFAQLSAAVYVELEKLTYSADKAYGDARYSDVKNQIQGIADKIAATYQMMNEEEGKKNTDSSKVAEYQNQIAELEVQAQELLSTMLEDIFGGTADSIAERLGNAFIEAFAAGQDAAQAWANEVNDIIADIMKRMLIQKFVEERIAAIFDKYKESWFSDGSLVIQEVLDSMGNLKDDLNQVGEDFATIFDSLPEDVKNALSGSADLAASAGKGITTASQESVDELNGRVTAIQGHTYELANNSRILVNNTTDILRYVRNIENIASSISGKVDSIETQVTGIKRSVDSLETYGINIK